METLRNPAADEFERRLKQIPDHNYRMSNIGVADTCLMAQLWFAANGLNPSAADILKFAEMVLLEYRRNVAELDQGRDDLSGVIAASADGI